ncbi:MAG TPA: transcriptional regulator, partial [Cryomorphaceae bacterium]|nr:transcriptional regulator [Cryomorphaceae bacterium]
DSAKFKFFLGYSGWAAGQLEEEISHGTWIVLTPPFEIEPLSMTNEAWRIYMKTLGGEFALWANAPDDPSMN